MKRLPIKNGTRLMPNVFRIAFKGSERIVKEDREIFKQWMIGKLSTEEATTLVSINNRIPVSKEQFLANADWLGYAGGRR